MSAETAFTGADLVLPGEVVRGTLLVRDGRIASVDDGRSALPAALDCEGDLVIPGLVELHTDHLEAHYAPRPKVRWDAMAAVAAHDVQVAGSGITTVLDALRVGTDEDARLTGEDARTLAAAVSAALADDHLRADHLLHLRCEVAAADMVDAFMALVDDPRVRLVSMMDHTPGQRQFTSLDAFRVYYQGKSGMTDEAFARFVERRVEAGRRHAPENRRRVAEAVRGRAIVLASHDDATEEHVAEAVREGASLSEFPTTMAAAEAARAAGMGIVMGAPNLVRGGSHSGNVATEAVAAAGRLDILSSDYVPSSLLQAALSLPERVPSMGLPEAVALVTERPAAAVGLADRGALEAGRRADLVRVRRRGGRPVVRGVWREGLRVA